MNNAEGNPEWLARRAVWRKDWTYVASYVKSSCITAKMQATLTEESTSPHRLILILGVYTSYNLEFGAMEDLKSIWKEALMFMRNRTPEQVDETRTYWNLSVARFYEQAGVSVDPKDFGFN